MSAEDFRDCLVIMPFGTARDEQLNSSLVFNYIIKPALEKAGAKPIRIDRKLLLHHKISDELIKLLQSAPLVLADLSGNKPNVLFELGVRLLTGRPFICISNDPSTALFSTKDYQIIDYTGDNAVQSIAAAIDLAFEESEVRLVSNDELKKLEGLVGQRDLLRNPFQDRVAAWRLGRAHEQLASIRNRRWRFEAKTPNARAAYMFSMILKLLKPGEEYLTVTNIGFWSDESVGQYPFLRANTEAASRGVRVKRVFLIDQARWVQPEYRTAALRLLREHEWARQQVEKTHPSGMKIKCHLSREFSNDLKSRYGHFGLVRHVVNETEKDDGCLLADPIYDSEGRITGLNLLFSNGSSLEDQDTAEYIEKFEIAYKVATDLDAFLLEHGDEVELPIGKSV